MIRVFEKHNFFFLSVNDPPVINHVYVFARMIDEMKGLQIRSILSWIDIHLTADWMENTISEKKQGKVNQFIKIPVWLIVPGAHN